MFKGFAVALLVAAVVVPVASAKSGTRARLSVLPLPASVIGPVAKSLPLQPDSGAALGLMRGVLLIPTHSFPPPPVWAKLGRVGGYGLDYGLGASGGAGVTEVSTNVDQYKTSADAKKGLAAWKSAERLWTTRWVGQSGQGGLAFRFKAENVAPVGSRRFAFLASYSAANIAPVFGLDEQFTEGRYEADVTVWAGSAATATTLAPSLARKLYARVKLALEGKLHAKPVKLPPKQKPGPPPGGPNLAALALQASDLSGPATVLGHFYFSDPLDSTALSAFNVPMNPAGPFDQLSQIISWCPSANQASFMADFWAANALSSGAFSQLDLSSLGDGARGFIANHSSGGEALVVFSSGQLTEYIQAESPNGVKASDVQKVAGAAANDINAAGLGS